MKCIPKEEFFVNVSCKTKPLGRYETLFTGNVYYVKIHKDMNVRSASNSGINFNLDVVRLDFFQNAEEEIKQ